MQVLAAVIAQAILLALALCVTCLRCFVRLKIEARALTLSDYLVWVGWFFALAWVTCQCKALYIELHDPLDENLETDSVDYLKTVFVSCFFFDVGLYFPKASITAFYWWLIPVGFRGMRIILYAATAYMVVAVTASVLTDLLICSPISDNWSIENQANSVWNSYTDLTINWILNISTDLILFVIPFFVIRSLKLRQRQTISLIGVFSLGLITMVMSLTRFIVYSASVDYDLSDADGALWCTAEMCTAVIVASLPGLKALITQNAIPRDTAHNRSNAGYVQTGSGQPGVYTSSSGKNSSRASRPKLYPDDDSEIELMPVELPADLKRGQSAKIKDVGIPQITVAHDYVAERAKSSMGGINNATNITVT